MDICPQGIGSKIGDFHKGQPTAGRQELPGHCHLGLNWNMPTRHKGCVCNHSIAPSQGFCFQLQGLCSGRGRRLKVPFIVPPTHTHPFFSSALPSAWQCRKGFPAPRLVIANEKVHHKSPQASGFRGGVVTKSPVRLRLLAPHQGLQGFLVT